MAPNELRALADALEPMSSAPRFEGMNVLAFCKWLRAQADAQPVAWMHIDGRVISAATMDQAYRDGGAMQSSLRDYTIPLYTHPAPAVPQEENNVWKQIIPDHEPQAEPDDDDELVLGEPDILTPEDIRRLVPQAEPKREPLSDSDADYWLRNRQAILDAIRREGFVLMSNACGFWLKRMDKVSEAHGIGGSDE